jgi:hypothetical protein
MSTEHTVTFSIANGMFSVDRLAKRLNAFVTGSRIADWHPGSWIDWEHAAIEIGFDSIEDAALAKSLCCEDTTGAIPRLVDTFKQANARARLEPER